MSDNIQHYIITRCESENENSASGGEWVEFKIPTPSGNLTINKDTKEWIWADGSKYSLYHTRYTTENHIAFVHDSVIHIYRILK
jgi:hypothetical protein